jgi:hypothetical protein
MTGTLYVLASRYCDATFFAGESHQIALTTSAQEQICESLYFLPDAQSIIQSVSSHAVVVTNWKSNGALERISVRRFL